MTTQETVRVLAEIRKTRCRELSLWLTFPEGFRLMGMVKRKRGLVGFTLGYSAEFFDKVDAMAAVLIISGDIDSCVSSVERPCPKIRSNMKGE